MKSRSFALGLLLLAATVPAYAQTPPAAPLAPAAAPASPPAPVAATLDGRSTVATQSSGRKTFTNGQAVIMLEALRNMDGRQVIVKQNGSDVAILTPWEFGSAALRLRIARNISALTELAKAIDDQRIGVIREILKTMPKDKDGKEPTSDILKPGMPEFDRLDKAYKEMLGDVASVNLARIRTSELRLDRNEISVTVLSALDPILDDDTPVPAK